MTSQNSGEEKDCCPYKFENLPDVILLKVFGLLNVGDLCRAGRVCVRWYHLTRSSILWKQVDAQDMQLSSYQLKKLIPILPPCVQFLRIQSLSTEQTIPFLTPRVSIEIRERCPQLQTLILESAYIAKHVHFTDMTIADLPENLSVLSLRKSFFHVDQFFSSIGHPNVPKIRVFDCSSCWCIKDYDIPFFLRLSDLQEIYLAGCPITDMGASVFLKTAENLKVIDLESTYVGDQTFWLFIRQFKSLEKLYLGYTKVTDYPLCVLPKDSLPRLSVLCLNNTSVSAVGLRSIILTLPVLRCLYINADSITQDCALELSCLVPIKRNLKVKRSPTFICPDYCDHFLDRSLSCVY